MKALKENKKFNEFVISLNTQDQLYQKGENIFGSKLVSPYATNKMIRNKIVYAPRTVFGTNEYLGKIEKGQPVDRITFKDRGIFYDSFELVLTPEFDLKIIAKDVNDLQKKWGKIIGLNDENYKKAIQKAQEVLTEHIKDQLKELKKAA